MKTSNKKAMEFAANWPFWLFFAMAVGGVGIFIVRTGNVSVEEASRIPEGLEDGILLASRFYNSEECFAYKDELGKVHAKVIDELKFFEAMFDKAIMDECFPPSEPNYAFWMTLKVPALEIKPPLEPFILTLKTFNYRVGVPWDREITEDVLVLREGNKYNATLTIRIKNVG